MGHATPDGVRQLIRFVKREVVEPTGEAVKVDWHGHRDRGLAVANCLAAIEEGADRIHGTALGIGERCGNAEMDLLLVNLKLLGLHDRELSKLADYVRLAAEACRVPRLRLACQGRRISGRAGAPHPASGGAIPSIHGDPRSRHRYA